VHNTVDNPIFPTQGVRYTAAIDLAGLGGNTNFYKPNLEGVWFWKQNPRMSLGAHANVEYIHQFTGSAPLPIFEKLFLGGEYSVRGFDIRSIGPSDPLTGLVLGGNKSLLFNLEQSITIAGPVRAILFYDAGQVRDTGERFSWWEDIRQPVVPSGVILTDPSQPLALIDPNAPPPQFTTIGRQSAFKTSTGVEIRFFMPVLNVPFRLIFYYDPQRGGVRDNNLQPQQAYGFRFAVGSTF
jgi:outer membrane protein assembly factor BamA